MRARDSNQGQHSLSRHELNPAVWDGSDELRVDVRLQIT
jgi:hypothetical protein